MAAAGDRLEEARRLRDIAIRRGVKVDADAVDDAKKTFDLLASWYVGLINQFSGIDAETFIISNAAMRAKTAKALAILIKDSKTLGEGAYGQVIESTTIQDGAGNNIAVKYEPICGVWTDVGYERCQSVIRGISYRLPHMGKTLLELPGPMAEGLVGMMMGRLEPRRVSPHFAQVITSFIVKQDDVPEAIRGSPTSVPHPFLFTLMVKYTTTLHDYLKKFDGEPKHHLALLALFQIAQALWAGQSTHRFAHNDLHLNNILIQQAKPGTYLYVSYNLNGKLVHMHVPFLIKISDYGYSVAELPATSTDPTYVLAQIGNYRYYDPLADFHDVVSGFRDIGIKFGDLLPTSRGIISNDFEAICSTIAAELRRITPFISDVSETDAVFTVGAHKLALDVLVNQGDRNRSYFSGALTIVPRQERVTRSGIPSAMLTPPLSLSGKVPCVDGKATWINKYTIALFDAKRMRDLGYTFRSYCCYTDTRGFWDDNPECTGIVINGSFFRYESYAPIGPYVDPRSYINETVYEKKPGVPPHMWSGHKLRRWIDPSAPIPTNYVSDYHYVMSDGTNIEILTPEEIARRGPTRKDRYLFAGGPLLVKNGIAVFTEDKLTEHIIVDTTDGKIRVPKYTCANKRFAESSTNNKTATITQAYNGTCEPVTLPRPAHVLHCNHIEPGELSHAANPNPRMALLTFPPGYTVSGKSYTGAFVFAEGRKLTSPGPTLPELAKLFVDLGVKDAINLDGGGSASMTWRDPSFKNFIISTDSTIRYPVGNIIGWVRGDPTPMDEAIEDGLATMFGKMSIAGAQQIIPGVVGPPPSDDYSEGEAAAGAGGAAMDLSE